MGRHKGEFMKEEFNKEEEKLFKIWEKNYEEGDFIAMKEEMEHQKNGGIPRCLKCKSQMKNDIDHITGKEGKYTWVTTCEHSKNLRLSIG